MKVKSKVNKVKRTTYVSKNDNCHCAGTTNIVVSYGNERLKRKTDIPVAPLTFKQ